MLVIHIQNMSKALIEKQTTYFVLSADIDMQGIKWAPLNDANGYHKWIDFDGRNHVVKNLTCESGTYRSFFGVLCGECRNVGFVDANISSSSTGIAIPVLLLLIKLLTIQVKPVESSEG